MTDKFDPRSLYTLNSEIEKRLEKTASVNLHLGYTAGVGAALDLIREHLSATHPLRKAVFDLLLEAKEDSVYSIIQRHAKIRDEKLVEHWKERAKT